jgi:hypothetical protein
MKSWPETVEKVERITFRVSTDDGHGTGFVVEADEGNLTIATAWHVIEGLFEVKDKFARRIEMVAASGTTKIEANAVGVARLGPADSDTGIVWVGKPFSSQGVDRILKTLAASGIPGGLLDLSGGGGVLAISGDRTTIESGDIPALLSREEVVKGMEVGWVGYPSVASESPCFFSGRLSGYLQAPFLYLVDGTGIRGLSGGPVFDERGRILGIVSAYLGPDTETLTGLMAVVPIADLNKMRSGYE